MKKNLLVAMSLLLITGCSANKGMVPAFSETAREHTPEQKQAYATCLKNPEFYLAKLGGLAPIGYLGSILKGGYAATAAKSLALSPMTLIASGAGLAISGVKYAVSAGKRSKEEMQKVEYCLMMSGNPVVGWYNVNDPKSELQPPVIDLRDKRMNSIAEQLARMRGTPPPAQPPVSQAQNTKNDTDDNPLWDEQSMEEAIYGGPKPVEQPKR